MSKPTVYLAGPVAAYDDGGAGWRADIEQQYGDVCNFENPLAKYNVPMDDLEVVAGYSRSNHEDKVGVNEIVQGDKSKLRNSDSVLVGYSDVKSIGTPMEVMWARERDYPVVIWIRDDTAVERLSPWYRYHATQITHLQEAAIAHCRGTVV